MTLFKSTAGAQPLLFFGEKLMPCFVKMDIRITNDKKSRLPCTRCRHYAQLQFILRIAGRFILVCDDCVSEEDFSVPVLSHEEFLLWIQEDPARDL